jgi:hypothetical protein
MLAAILPVLGSIFGQVTKSLFPDPADELKRIELENQLQLAMMQNGAALDQAAASIVSDEAKGESWLQRNWRPLTMMTFVGLVVAKWLGFTAPGVSEAIELELMTLIQIGLGGYVGGRTIEKIAPAIAAAMKK